MADLQLLGRRNRSTAHWILTSKFLSSNVQPSTCTIDNNDTTLTVMEDDDPWFWDVDRVVQELCTDQRSWVPKTSSPRMPDPTSLEKCLRDQEIDGSTLLTEIDEADLRNEFGLLVRGPRATIKHAIGELRYMSTQYQSWKKRHSEKPLTSISIYSAFGAGSHGDRDSIDFRIPQVDSLPLTSLAGPDKKEKEWSPFSRPEPIAQGQTMQDHLVHGESDIISEPFHKRRRLDLSDPQTIYHSQDHIDVGGVADGNDVQFSSDTLTGICQNPAETKGAIPAASTVEEILPLRSPVPEKKRKRIAPTLVSEIILQRSRNIPTAADAVNAFNPQNIEPGITYHGSDGKKRLLPILQSDSDPKLTQMHQEQLLRKLSSPKSRVLSGSDQDSMEPTKTLPATTTENLADDSESREVGYLGKKRFPVDDVFYGTTIVGAELPGESDDDDSMSIVRENISSGRRLYIHKIMKKFLLSKPQVISRGGKSLKAVIPYSSHLIQMHKIPSFTLFHSTGNGGTRVTKESLSKWPELDPTMKSKIPINDDERLAQFNLPENLKLGGPSSYDDWDPEYLDKYRHIEGGDTVLPLYGESDEDNAYDEETWNEIQKECGTLEQPLLRLKKHRLTSEEVDLAMDESIAQIVAKWKTEKLPKLQQKAWKIWRKSRRDGNKRQQIRESQQHLDRINNKRLVSLREEIHGEVWTSAKQVRWQTKIMEQSIFDRENLLWRILLLEQKKEPEKPPSDPLQAKIKKPPKPVGHMSNDDDESIGTESQSSSSDDGLDDFIVDDDIGSGGVEEMEINRTDDEPEDATAFEPNSSSESEVPDKKSVPLAGNDTIMEALGTNEIHKETNLVIGPKARKDQPKDFVFVDDSEPCRANSESDTSPISVEAQAVDVNTPVESISMLPSQRLGARKETAQDVIVITSDSSSEEDFINIPRAPEKSNLKHKVRAGLKREETPVSSKSVIELDSEDASVDELPGLNDTTEIARYITRWEKIGDRERLLIGIIHKKLDEKTFISMRDLIHAFPNEKLWEYTIQVLHALGDLKDKVKGMDQKTFSILIKTIQLFEMYVSCRYIKRRKCLSQPTITSLEESKSLFSTFYKTCYQTLNEQNFKEASHISSNGDGIRNDSESYSVPQLASGRRSKEINSSSSDVEEHQTPHRVRKRKIFENAQARSLRKQDQERLREQEQRRQVLRQKLAKSGTSVNADRARIIINDGKFEHQGFVYINEEIGKRIKNHQIEGVQFMWNQIVANEGAMQGCLLAHTMGLGKTMQVITLLVAIAEAASSKDKTVSSQIPPSLCNSKTLILCPPGIIDNWMDELLTWAPVGILGRLRKIDSVLKDIESRLAAIESWDQEGGVLIMGYEMFRIYIQNKGTKRRGPQLLKEEHERVMKQLLEGPNIIVADEAHKMKNANASITSAAMMFKSRSRIALTGSPLANNVEEYHTMIEWVAPNYLGPAVEFRAKYVEPIQAGLWNDSTSYERRRSLKMLEILKEDLSPKVHRAGLAVLRHDLKPKTEFIITVPLTAIQIKAYTLYVRSMLSRAYSELTKDGKVSQATLWHWLSVLSLLCNHPECFKAKLMDRKEAAKKEMEAKSKKQNDSVEDEVSDDDYIADTTPIWKTGVSEDLIQQEMELFNAFGSDLSSFENSNKVKILLQILDASKAVGDKVLIFSQSIPTLNYLEMMCQRTKRDYARLDGHTKISERQSLTKQFNIGQTELYLISTTAGGLGLNLFGANRVVIFDFKFNPTNEEQAVGRAYRIGQRKPVYVYRFIAGGTFEDKMQNRTVFKMQLASRVVDKKNPLAWAKKDAGDFLFEPKPVEQLDLSSFKGMDPGVLDPILDRQRHDSSIRSIVITDTFERHDDEELTAEEKKEVKQALSDEQLKRSNPQKYAAELQRRQMELLKAANIQDLIAQPGLPSTSTSASVKQGAIVSRSASGSILPPTRPQMAFSQSQPPTVAPVVSGQQANSAIREIPGLTPILGANTKIISGKPNEPAGVSKNTPRHSTIFGVENAQVNIEERNASQTVLPVLHHSRIQEISPAAKRPVGEDGFNQGGIEAHKALTKNAKIGSVNTSKNKSPQVSVSQQVLDQQLYDAVKEACRLCNAIPGIDSQESEQKLKQTTERLRQAIEIRVDVPSLTPLKTWEVIQGLKQTPTLINNILAGDADKGAAIRFQKANSSAHIGDSIGLTSLTPTSDGILTPSALSPQLISNTESTRDPRANQAPHETSHLSSLKSSSIILWKREASIQDIRGALQTTLSNELESGGKPLGMYTNVQEAAEKVAREIGRELADNAGGDLGVFSAAVSLMLEFVRGRENCEALTHKEADLRQLAQRMIQKVSSDLQTPKMTDSAETRKVGALVNSSSPDNSSRNVEGTNISSNLHIPTEQSVRSLRTPLPKRPKQSRRDPYQSPRAKVDMDYFEKAIANRKSHGLELSEPSGVTMFSTQPSPVTPLPNWALDEIEKAKNGSPGERRSLNRSSRTPSLSQPPQYTP